MGNFFGMTRKRASDDPVLTTAFRDSHHVIQHLSLEEDTLDGSDVAFGGRQGSGKRPLFCCCSGCTGVIYLLGFVSRHAVFGVGRIVASKQVVGRLATQIQSIIRGKVTIRII